MQGQFAVAPTYAMAKSTGWTDTDQPQLKATPMANRPIKIIALLVAGVVGLFLLVAALAQFLGLADMPSAEEQVQADPVETKAPPQLDDFIASGRLAYAQQDIPGLSTEIERLKNEAAPQACVQLLEALKLSLEQDTGGALNALHAIADNPLVRPAALAYAGELLFKRQDMQNAEGVLKAALIADPNQVDPHRYLAAYYYDVGAMDNALLHLEHVARLEPKDARPWRMRGMILSDFERHPEAIEAYAEALSRDLKPHVAQEVHGELAASLLAARQPDEALNHLAQCDSTPAIESMRAECQLSLGNYPAAEESLSKALNLDPNHAGSLMIKATLAREQGNLELAESTLQQAVQHHPFEFDFRAQYMSVLAALGKKEEAEIQRQELERLQELRATFTELHHQSMEDPSSSEIRFQLGQTAEQLGKFEMALSWYQAALAIDPQNEKAKASLELLISKFSKP